MTFDEYQIEARKTAIYKNVGSNYHYPLLGLGNEVGEIFGKCKKLERDYDSILTPEYRAKIADEISDVLWYLSNLCSEFNLKFGDIAVRNLEKLRSRQERGVLKGDGDNR